MHTTTNYGLKKPDPSDAFNQENDNDNMDIIDAKLKANEDAAATAQSTADGAIPNSAGAVSDSNVGNRTISDAMAPTGDSGTITSLFGWLANMIKAITGKSSWRTAPATTLEAANSHMNATTGVHGATNAATANTIMQRDTMGRAKVAAPAAADDIARLDSITAANSSVEDTAGHFASNPKNVENVLAELFTLASNGKNAIVAALAGMNQNGNANMTFSQLAALISAISTDATATPGDVLINKTFYHDGRKSGTMPNLSGNWQSTTFKGSYSNGSYYGVLAQIPKGYSDGGTNTYTLCYDSNFKPENIRKNTVLYGVTGTMEQGYIAGDAVPYAKARKYSSAASCTLQSSAYGTAYMNGYLYVAAGDLHQIDPSTMSIVNSVSGSGYFVKTYNGEVYAASSNNGLVINVYDGNLNLKRMIDVSANVFQHVFDVNAGAIVVYGRTRQFHKYNAVTGALMYTSPGSWYIYSNPIFVLANDGTVYFNGATSNWSGNGNSFYMGRLNADMTTFVQDVYLSDSAAMLGLTWMSRNKRGYVYIGVQNNGSHNYVIRLSSNCQSVWRKQSDTNNAFYTGFEMGDYFCVSDTGNLLIIDPANGNVLVKESASSWMNNFNIPCSDDSSRFFGTANGSTSYAYRTEIGYTIVS